MLHGSRTHSFTSERRGFKASSTPTLLIPGWGGGTWSTDKMIQTFQNKKIAQKAMTVWVFPNGRTIIKGSLDQHQKNPLIQLLYVWNYSATYQPQTRQLTIVLKKLHNSYGVNKMNVIAHSYGGTEFMHAYIGSPSIQKMIDFRKIVLLGVPVDESFGTKTRYRLGLAKKSKDDNFKILEKEIKSVHTHHNDQIFNLMGSKDGERTDGSVPHIQSEMLRNLIKDHPNIQYHEHIYAHTSHPMLHQKSNIINDVAHYLWSDD
ncbi:alpha/beta hydrolase [Limosilactobacillus sp.]|uniref:alpha/beta hydrolase n=1 Tax=Limosilactobacillus sp. TaxID=2773925 RepID=UPI00345EF154